jgi:hypothetical protein
MSSLLPVAKAVLHCVQCSKTEKGAAIDRGMSLVRVQAKRRDVEKKLAKLLVRQAHVSAGLFGLNLFQSTQPGILPRNRDVLIVPAVSDVSAIAVAELYRLVLAHRD